MFKNNLPNQDIRDLISKEGLRQHEVFNALGISEPTWTRLMRVTLSDTDRQRIISVINSFASDVK